MPALTLDQAQTIISAALRHARAGAMLPLAVCVLDARGALKAFAAEDGTSLKRAEIARAKADGALALGLGAERLVEGAVERGHDVAPHRRQRLPVLRVAAVLEQARALHERAQDQPQFIAAATAALGGSLIPVPGGVLIRAAGGEIAGVVGVSGDISDNDEACAIAGIAAAGFAADPGEG